MIIGENFPREFAVIIRQRTGSRNKLEHTTNIIGDHHPAYFPGHVHFLISQIVNQRFSVCIRPLAFSDFPSKQALTRSWLSASELIHSNLSVGLEGSWRGIYSIWSRLKHNQSSSSSVNGVWELTEHDDRRHRKNPSDFSGEHCRAHNDFDGLRPSLMEHRCTLSYTLCVCTHQCDGFFIVRAVRRLAKRYVVGGQLRRP